MTTEQIFSELGLEAVNDGGFDGSWTASGDLLRFVQGTPSFQFTPSPAHAGRLLTLKVVETYLLGQPPASMDGSHTVTWYILVDGP